MKIVTKTIKYKIMTGVSLTVGELLEQMKNDNNYDLRVDYINEKGEPDHAWVPLSEGDGDVVEFNKDKGTIDIRVNTDVPEDALIKVK